MWLVVTVVDRDGDLPQGSFGDLPVTANRNLVRASSVAHHDVVEGPPGHEQLFVASAKGVQARPGRRSGCACPGCSPRGPFPVLHSYSHDRIAGVGLEQLVRFYSTFEVGREGFEPSTLGLRVPCSTS